MSNVEYLIEKRMLEALDSKGAPAGIPLKSWGSEQFKFWDLLAQQGYVPDTAQNLFIQGKSEIMKPYMEVWADLGWDLAEAYSGMFDANSLPEFFGNLKALMMKYIGRFLPNTNSQNKELQL